MVSVYAACLTIQPSNCFIAFKMEGGDLDCCAGHDWLPTFRPTAVQEQQYSVAVSSRRFPSPLHLDPVAHLHLQTQFRGNHDGRVASTKLGLDSDS
jgi:hypothetical protein